MLLLPNAWDALRARVVQECGAQAIATTSSGLSWSHGYPDGEALPTETLLAAVREIVPASSLPVTVDAEAGYADDPEQTGALVGAGLPPLSVLRGCGVRRVSAGASLCHATFGAARQTIGRFLSDHQYDLLLERAVAQAELNAMFARPGGRRNPPWQPGRREVRCPCEAHRPREHASAARDAAHRAAGARARGRGRRMAPKRVV
jgi:2-methylisocitrate lyase-like PEP mutase family enzyme